MKIEVHSKTDCPHCVSAKEWLTARGIPFELSVYDDYEDRQKMYDTFGLEGDQRTVPQIVVDGVRLNGGWAGLRASDVADRFSAGDFTADF